MGKSLVMGPKEQKALRTLLEYCTADEAQNYDGDKNHIWLSIKSLWEFLGYKPQKTWYEEEAEFVSETPPPNLEFELG